MSELSLTVVRDVHAPIRAVYEAWLNPAMLAKFMIPAPGMSVPEVNVDARVGGRFEIVMANGNDRMPHAGEYKVLNPHSQIVFTWESPFSVDGSTVTVNLTESEGKTRVELHHVRFPNAESRDHHNAGWGAILALLESTLESTPDH